MIHIFLVICYKKFHVFHKSDSSWSRDNQGRKIYSGGHACLTKENVTDMLHAS